MTAARSGRPSACHSGTLRQAFGLPDPDPDTDGDFSAGSRERVARVHRESVRQLNVARLGGVLRVSARTAEARMHTARVLHQQLPATRAALAAGVITGWSAHRLVEETDRLTPAERAQVDAAVLDPADWARVARWTTGQVVRKTRRAVLRLAPPSWTEQAQQAVRERAVHLRPGLFGMAHLSADLPALDAEIVWQALDALAHANHSGAQRAATAGSAGSAGSAGGAGAGSAGGDGDAAAEETEQAREMSLSAGRADALVALARAVLADPTLPTVQGQPVTVNVVIDLPTLLGLTDEPAHLPGDGPLPAEVVRAVAGDAGWRRWITDPVTGHLLDYGTALNRPPRALRNYLLAAHPTCTFPGCTRRSHRCELDHATPFPRHHGRPAPTAKPATATATTTTTAKAPQALTSPDPAPPALAPPRAAPPPPATSAAGMHPLCPRHHWIKTFGGWTATLGTDRTVHWTAPTGHTFTTPPPRILDD